jgi:hypothetical protein
MPDISDQSLNTVVGYIAIEGTRKSYERIKKWIKMKAIWKNGNIL